MNIDSIIENLYENMMFGGNRLFIAFCLIVIVSMLNSFLLVKLYNNIKLVSILFVENVLIVSAIFIIWAVVVLVSDDLGQVFSSKAMSLGTKYQFAGLLSLISFAIGTIIMIIRLILNKRKLTTSKEGSCA